MNRIRNAKWSLVFDKVGTILVDRRFWLNFVFPVIFALGIFPHVTEANAENLSDQAVGWSELIVGTVVPILSAYVLGNSWTKRPPSGLGFKELISELGTTLRDLGIK